MSRPPSKYPPGGGAGTADGVARPRARAAPGVRRAGPPRVFAPGAALADSSVSGPPAIRPATT
ncbi:peptidase S08 family protein, partial [Streptomyces celluloflavus]